MCLCGTEGRVGCQYNKMHMCVWGREGSQWVTVLRCLDPIDDGASYFLQLSHAMRIGNKVTQGKAKRKREKKKGCEKE